jgi:hypothetical protein
VWLIDQLTNALGSTVRWCTVILNLNLLSFVVAGLVICAPKATNCTHSVTELLELGLEKKEATCASTDFEERSEFGLGGQLVFYSTLFPRVRWCYRLTGALISMSAASRRTDWIFGCHARIILVLDSHI